MSTSGAQVNLTNKREGKKPEREPGTGRREAKCKFCNAFLCRSADFGNKIENCICFNCKIKIPKSASEGEKQFIEKARAHVKANPSLKSLKDVKASTLRDGQSRKMVAPVVPSDAERSEGADMLAKVLAALGHSPAAPAPAAAPSAAPAQPDDLVSLLAHLQGNTDKVVTVLTKAAAPCSRSVVTSTPPTSQCRPRG